MFDPAAESACPPAIAAVRVHLLNCEACSPLLHRDALHVVREPRIEGLK